MRHITQALVVAIVCSVSSSVLAQGAPGSAARSGGIAAGTAARPRDHEEATGRHATKNPQARGHDQTAEHPADAASTSGKAEPGGRRTDQAKSARGYHARNPAQPLRGEQDLPVAVQSGDRPGHRHGRLVQRERRRTSSSAPPSSASPPRSIRSRAATPSSTAPKTASRSRRRRSSRPRCPTISRSKAGASSPTSAGSPSSTITICRS